MQADYLKQAKSFLAQNSTRLALRAIPMALVAVAAAHATPTFNAPTSTSISGCSGGTTGGSLTGAAANGGAEMSLSGSASVSVPSSGYCNLLMVWKGTASGAFASASYSSRFVITPPSNVTVTAYSLTILINGVAQTTVTCSSQLEETALKPVSKLKPNGAVLIGCGGTITVPLTNLSASGALSTYEADLSVTGYWYTSNQSTLNVNVPAGATIDIFATGPVAVPALSPLTLTGTALLLALAAFRMAAWKTSSGTPGPQA